MSDTDQNAKDAFDSGLYCAEAVLTVIAQKEGVESELLPRIATGFCSGMARTCGTCGAVTGGVLALNMVYGRNGSNDSVEQNYSAVQKFVDLFGKEFGSVNCQELLGCDLGTEIGQKLFEEEQLHNRCREFAGRASELVIHVIEREKP